MFNVVELTFKDFEPSYKDFEPTSKDIEYKLLIGA